MLMNVRRLIFIMVAFIIIPFVSSDDSSLPSIDNNLTACAEVTPVGFGCFGYLVQDKTRAEERQYNLSAAGGFHTCAIRSD